MIYKYTISRHRLTRLLTPNFIFLIFNFRLDLPLALPLALPPALPPALQHYPQNGFKRYHHRALSA